MSIMSYAANVTVQVGIMLILILIGFTAAKLKWIDKNGSQQLVNLLFNIVTPAVIINAFLSVDFTADRAVSLLVVAGCALLVHFIGFIIAMPLFHKEDCFRRPVLRLGVIFSNCGFMSLPLAAALLGSEGVFYVSIYVVIHNVVVWTLGVSLFNNKEMSWRKAIINPGTIGVFIGLPLFLLKVQLPTIISAPIGYMADLNTPLAMIVIGFFLSGTAFRIQKGDGKLFKSMLLRLIVVPAVALLIFRLLPIDSNLLMACMIPASAPVAANVPMFAAMFDSDVDSSSRIVSVSTLLSVITIPIFLSLAQMVSTM